MNRLISFIIRLGNGIPLFFISFVFIQGCGVELLGLGSNTLRDSETIQTLDSQLGGSDQSAVLEPPSDSSADPIWRAGDDLSFLFTTFKKDGGSAGQKAHRLNLYFAVDVSDTMRASRDNLVKNLGGYLGMLGHQNHFDVTAQFMLFSQLCIRKRMIQLQSFTTQQEYQDYLDLQIKIAMPKGSDKLWDCDDARSGEYQKPELAFEAVKRILQKIQLSRQAAGQNHQKIHPVVVVITDNPSALKGYKAAESVTALKKSFQEWAEQIKKPFESFRWMKHLRLYASLKNEPYLQKQYERVFQLARSAGLPKDQGHMKISFPFSDLSFRQLVGSVSSSVAIKESFTVCMLMEASLSSPSQIWTTADIRKQNLKFGMLTWEDALIDKASEAIYVTEKRCCLSVSQKSILFSPQDLPADLSRCDIQSSEPILVSELRSSPHS